MSLGEHGLRRQRGPPTVVQYHPVPGPLQETINTFDSMFAPLRIEFRRPHKQFIHTQRVATEITNEFVGVYNVSFRLRHFFGLAAFADVRNHSLVEQSLKRLIEIDYADIMQKHCEEPCI